MDANPSTDGRPAATQRRDLVLGEHQWDEWGRLTYCRWCGVVRRRDGANKPCKGVVPVELRRASPAVASRSDLVDRLARQLYVGVELYHDREPGDFDELPDDQQWSWLHAAEHAIESAVDRIITAGRPIWWTTP